MRENSILWIRISRIGAEWKLPLLVNKYNYLDRYKRHGNQSSSIKIQTIQLIAPAAVPPVLSCHHQLPANPLANHTKSIFIHYSQCIKKVIEQLFPTSHSDAFWNYPGRPKCSGKLRKVPSSSCKQHSINAIIYDILNIKS